MMLSRWWVYQGERFPILKNGLLIAVFSGSAVSYSTLLTQQRSIPLASVVVAFVSIFLFFLQLRIADEFKDFEDDSRYRPYRAVPRGIVSLNELALLGFASAIIQLGVALWLAPALALLLGAIWFYFSLMCFEFFVAKWLKVHPLIYMLSHMVIVPLINLYGTACEWLVAGTTLSNSLFWFLVASFCNGMVIEIGRKIRSPKDEEFGVDTYSAVWGSRKAVLAWLAVLGLTAVAAWMAAVQINFSTFVGWLLGILLSCAVGVAWLFLNQPITKWAKLIEVMSGLWTLLLYLCLGIVPLLVRL